ncbi:putative disease resistance RPP13-like protein 1 [Chenopodium quinoa]|uniref:putative disease resistance RPP13-like protein 1 n=1 Tax=Chenopodium quinoa TaxID=63459 RepID=UPI000B78A19F|nr:putative disease resistance RPP13-like protein 1 [Chenopodium quinoa]
MELVGETYFNILLNHSFLEKKEGYYVDGIRYKMHDLVHDLAAYILENELLVWKVGSKRVDFSHVRHLVFDLAENESPPETFSHWLTTRKLRTLCFRGSVPSWKNLFGSARFVRVLIMDDLGLTEVPFFIGQLVHLRYLDLSYNDFDILPACICKLYELQTLRIFGCSKLEPLPRELHRLENLRHILTQDTLLASTRLRQLTNLQTLPPLELRDGEGWTIDELGPLDQLKGEVIIRGLQHVKNKEEARQAGLGRKDKIVKLHLQWRDDREAVSQVNNDEDVLDSLEPHSNLQSLYVDMFMGVRFPWWIMTAHMNLVEVRLLRCLRCLELPSLGQLPLLRILMVGMLDDLECIGETFY